MKTWFVLPALVWTVYSASVEDCPGYTVSNVVESDGVLTADLSLAGDACNIYGMDLVDLKLLVEYQTGAFSTITVNGFVITY